MRTAKKSIRIRFTLFGIRIVQDFKFQNIQYISVFSNNGKDFTISFWFSEKHRKDIVTKTDKEESFDFATAIATHIGVKVLDTTEKGNSKWIDFAESES